jgi:hypothetical protein
VKVLYAASVPAVLEDDLSWPALDLSVRLHISNAAVPGICFLILEIIYMFPHITHIPGTAAFAYIYIYIY